MIKNAKSILALMALLLMSTIFSPAAAQDNDCGPYRASVSVGMDAYIAHPEGAMLRPAPSRSYKPDDYVDYGVRVTLHATKCADGYRWFHVETPEGGFGWTMARLSDGDTILSPNAPEGSGGTDASGSSSGDTGTSSGFKSGAIRIWNETGMNISRVEYLPQQVPDINLAVWRTMCAATMPPEDYCTIKVNPGVYVVRTRYESVDGTQTMQVFTNVEVIDGHITILYAEIGYVASTIIVRNEGEYDVTKICAQEGNYVSDPVSHDCKPIMGKLTPGSWVKITVNGQFAVHHILVRDDVTGRWYYNVPIGTTLIWPPEQGSYYLTGDDAQDYGGQSEFELSELDDTGGGSSGQPDEPAEPEEPEEDDEDDQCWMKVQNQTGVTLEHFWVTENDEWGEDQGRLAHGETRAYPCTWGNFYDCAGKDASGNEYWDAEGNVPAWGLCVIEVPIPQESEPEQPQDSSPPPSEPEDTSPPPDDTSDSDSNECWITVFNNTGVNLEHFWVTGGDEWGPDRGALGNGQSQAFPCEWGKYYDCLGQDRYKTQYWDAKGNISAGGTCTIAVVVE